MTPSSTGTVGRGKKSLDRHVNSIVVGGEENGRHSSITEGKGVRGGGEKWGDGYYWERPDTREKAFDQQLI